MKNIELLSRQEAAEYLSIPAESYGLVVVSLSQAALKCLAMDAGLSVEDYLQALTRYGFLIYRKWFKSDLGYLAVITHTLADIWEGILTDFIDNMIEDLHDSKCVDTTKQHYEKLRRSVFGVDNA
jgi:hypothetical protein